MDILSWPLGIVVVACVGLLILLGVWLARRRRRPDPLPIDWALTARPVFSSSERRVHQLLREALPHHVILAKLPLVRLCQPVDPEDVRYWFDVLGTTHVSFAVCSANGRVLAAIDLDRNRAGSRRTLQIKQSVLGACRIRYLRWAVESPPTASELQMLIPSAHAKSAMPASTAGLAEARDSLSSTVASRRAGRAVRWQESGGYQDSFFAFDSRLDGFGASEFGAMSPDVETRVRAAMSGHATEPATLRDPSGSAIGGVVVDGPGEAARR